MRASKVAAPLLAMAVLLAAAPAGGLTDEERAGGWTGELPTGIVQWLAPNVDFKNVTIAKAPTGETNKLLDLVIKPQTGYSMSNLSLTLEIYRFALLGLEEDLGGWLDQSARPRFSTRLNSTTMASDQVTLLNASVPSGSEWHIQVKVTVPGTARMGFYRVRLSMSCTVEFKEDSYASVVKSRGYFTDAQWAELLEKASRDHNFTVPVAGVNGILPEAGFTVAPPRFDYVSRPNRVPDFGNFTTPVIRPGGKGKYNFTISNRYDGAMTNVALEVSLYMWATLEESKAIDRLGGPRPKFDNADTTTMLPLGSIASGGKAEPELYIRTSKDTPKGTYFVRHRLTFTYNGTEYTMSSRGYFTTPQWEGFDYGNLYYQLNVSGIVPDSSVSVKDPVPLWPLALLVGLCVLFGALAVVFYLAEEHGSEYPRLKKALQYWTGKLEQRRRLVQQRLDELRREVDVPLDDDEP